MNEVNTVIYVDVLLVINYIVNLLLILCTGKILGKIVKRKRLVASAIIGALSSLIIFVPNIHMVLSTAYKLIVAIIMVFTAFGYTSFWVFIKRLFVLFTVSFLFAGVCLALYMTLNAQNMLYYNGIVYFQLSSFTLIVYICIAYIGVEIFNRIFSGKIKDFIKYHLAIEYSGETVEMTAIIDTGNGLREPFSQIPVIICNAETLKKLPIQQDVTNFRVIPYSTVGNTGLLKAFLPDKVILKDAEKSYIIHDVYVAFGEQSIGNGEYSALINPDVFKVTL